ncbi:MAG: HAD hydrolase-like protein [Desulfosarcinaceae bacterium]|nr:HAD hydrolase-like protein [Desulfosarcinaceae bacterium]
MKQTQIMFDLDGTLLDTADLYLEGVPPIVSTHLGIEVSPEALWPLWGQHARRFFQHFAAEAGCSDRGLIDQMYAEFERFYNQAHNVLSKPYPGVVSQLPSLRSAGFRTAVVTTRPTSRSGPVLELPFCQWIDDFVWGDTVARSKPAPDGLIRAMADRDAVKGVYVGDNPHDVAAAKACPRPVLSVAALWGAIAPERLMVSAPDHAFATFSEFVEWALTLD